jgi:hypothetical protein
MRFRLFKPNRPVRRAVFAFSALHSWLLVGACSGGAFTASSGGGSAGASAGDTANTAGDSGSSDGGSPSAGSAGHTTAGSAGKAATSCDCSAGTGTYCQDGTSNCRPCADFTRLEFAAPQKLSSLAQAPGSIERFPRVAGAGSALFYTSGNANNIQIWYAPTPISGVGAPVTEATRVESGPLLAAGYVQQNFFFDRREATAAANRKLWVGDWSGTALSGAALAPAPYNALKSDDYSIAVAPNAQRAFWMSTRNGSAELLSYSPANAATPPAVFDVKVSINCQRVGDDATPWVSVDGKVLLFRSQAVDSDCNASDSGANDLFAVPLAKDGTAATNAVSLSALNSTGGGSDQTDPSFSQDLCSIFFASDNGSPGDYDLYRAARK